MATTESCTLSLRDALPISGERRLHLDLAGQPAVRPALGRGAVEQRILVVGDRLEFRGPGVVDIDVDLETRADRKSTRLNSSHQIISYAVFCLKKKTKHDRG